MKAEGGYTYLTMLIVVFTVTLAAQATWVPASTVSIRAKEQELIFRGQAYQAAISSYYLADPKNPSFPRSLEDLLDDPRFSGRRHIRSLYDDPISRGQWSVITGEGGITGVASTSDRQPLKVSGFPYGLENFDNSVAYSDWHFVFVVAEKY